MAPMTSASYTELEHLRVRVRLLQGMVGHINAGLDVKEMVERTLLEAHKTLPEFRISYSTFDESTGEMAVVNSVAPLNMPGVAGKRFDLQRTRELALMLRGGVPVAVSDVETDARMAGLRDVANSMHARALLYVPVQHPLGPPGLVGLASPVAHEWSSHEIAMVADIAAYLAIAVRESSMQQEREEMNRQLRESQKMEAVGQLVGGVAHDFNNLLTGIMIYTGLLSTALGNSSPLQRHVREIQNAGERGASLVAQLLSLSRHQVLDPEVLSVNDVIQDMRDMLQRMVGEEVRIECHLAPDAGFSRLDESLLRQTILNLALNARDAMPTGGQLIFRTRLASIDHTAAASVPGLLPGEYVVLSVSDDGTGMSPEILTRCFEPFFTTKAQGEGTGLGLAGVYGMVLQHSGAISVKSAPREGTTFNLYFPVTLGSAAGPAGLNESGGRRETVMLVEDEELLRLPLTEQLQAEGYHVLSADTPAAALVAAASFGGVIDVLVTDLVMPGMTGADLAERLAADRPEMRVLFISGYTNDARARELIAAGADFLRKPFDSATFAARVRARMDQARSGLVPPRPKGLSAMPCSALLPSSDPAPDRPFHLRSAQHPGRQHPPQQKSVSTLEKRDIE